MASKERKTEDRVKFDPKTSPPNSWVCYLFMLTHDLKPFICNGFKIHLKDVNRTLVVTSGQALYQRGHMVKNATVFVPGKATVTVETSDMYVAPEYIQDGNPDYDYGMLSLPGTSDEGFGWSAILSDAELNNRIVNKCSYLEVNDTMGITGGPITKYTDKRIFYRKDATIDLIGSPIYTWDDGNWTVIGINTGATHTECLNYGVRLIPEMFRRFFRQMPFRAELTLRSHEFPDVYMRCEASGVTECTPSGGGTVNCQFKPAQVYERYHIYPVRMKPSLERFEKYLVHIESTHWDNVYIRMDASGMSAPSLTGGGIVNCQHCAGPYEKFYLRREEGTTLSFQSFEFPHCKLRLDGTDVIEHIPNGGGKVNCQYYYDTEQLAGALERFYMESV